MVTAMRVKRVESVYIRPSDRLSRLCHIAKNLYNDANYIVRQKFIKKGIWVRYYDLWQQLKTTNYFKILPYGTAQQILRALDSNWKAFFQSIKEWKKHPEKFRGRPKLPGYKEKDGEFPLIFSNIQVRLKNNKVKLPQKIRLKGVKTRLSEGVKLGGARIVPQGIGYQLEIIYEKEVPEPPKKPKRIAGIDFGVNNLVTVGTNIGKKPIVVKGGVVKSWNQYYNKELARLKSVYDLQGIKASYYQKKLSLKRKRKLKDFFHKTSRAFINWCVKRHIDTIVMGCNKGWKQEANLGKRNNQSFVFIPFDILRNQIRYKAEEHGIATIDTEEDYTSKCSFLDLEPIKHHKKYLGQRIERGLFRASDGRTINADLNAAYNIIRKVFPKAFAKGIEGLGMAPWRLSI